MLQSLTHTPAKNQFHFNFRQLAIQKHQLQVLPKLEETG